MSDLSLEDKIMETLIWCRCFVTRNYLMAQLQAPRTTIYDALERLLDKGKVERSANLRVRGKKGRPYVYWRAVR